MVPAQCIKGAEGNPPGSTTWAASPQPLVQGLCRDRGHEGAVARAFAAPASLCLAEPLGAMGSQGVRQGPETRENKASFKPFLPACAGRRGRGLTLVSWLGFLLMVLPQLLKLELTAPRCGMRRSSGLTHPPDNKATPVVGWMP